ncbi:hypothetical protein BN2476_680049 [Paraburkholderia piptadeniae]|uniref:Uncharacterized protein n=1 Tax=Paraburkholderia piptadeniae TaxID=1701573 RepID=A0A1N7SPD1_9BURK|nr:hypothetical protein [Paraburkholderia piptadeniae]SIT49284.1 hypothetical protein BN2476_680049 [Paraburkholderia piptadeniae]
MTNRIELEHDENYAKLLHIKRDIYTVGGSVAFDQAVLKEGYEVFRSGGAGFLSIASPVARMEICEWRGRHAIVWDARWLEFVTAFCRLNLPRFLLDETKHRPFRWNGFVDLENLVTLFLMEQLCFRGESEVGLALSLKKMLVSKGLTATAVLTTPPPFPDAQLRRLYKDCIRFFEDSMQHLTLSHEFTHLAFNLGVLQHDVAAEQLKPLVGQLVDLARRCGPESVARFTEQERRFGGTEIIEEICRRLLGDGTSNESIEESYCDVNASSHYARRYVAPRVARHNDNALFRRGYWVIVNYHTALFLFHKIAFTADTIISRKGWYGVGFSGAAAAREGISRSIYRNAVKNVGGRCTFSNRADELQRDFDRLDHQAATLLSETFECLSDFAFDQRWAGWTARASDEVVAAGGIEAARGEVLQFLGWPRP